MSVIPNRPGPGPLRGPATEANGGTLHTVASCSSPVMLSSGRLDTRLRGLLLRYGIGTERGKTFGDRVVRLVSAGGSAFRGRKVIPGGPEGSRLIGGRDRDGPEDHDLGRV